MYLGISCLRSDWYGVEVADQPGRELQVRRLEKRTGVLPEEGILARLESLVDLTPHNLKSESGNGLRTTEEEASHHAFEVLEGTDVGRWCHDWGEKQTSPVDIVGISHPYALSPATRRALSALADGVKPVRARRRSGRDVSHVDLESDGDTPRLCALETPLAVALELAATKQVEMPSVLVIVSPGSSGHEVTVIDVRRTVESLKLSVTGFGQLSQTSLSVQHLTAWNCGTRIDASAIVHVGDDAADPAKQISELLKTPNVISATEFDAAAGVARYAVLCDKRNLKLAGTTISGLDCRLIAPHAIGICCRSESEGDSDIYWCPVIEARAPLSDQEIAVRLGMPFPDEIVLAECVSSTRDPQTWVVGLQDLRWHSHVGLLDDRDPGQATGECQLSLRIEGSAGCTHYGWSDPIARAEIRP
jgi:hypothetical protein